MEYVICAVLVHYMSSQKGDFTILGPIMIIQSWEQGRAHQYGMHSKKHI